MTKCHFGLYGGSGTLQKFDALCVLGMNIINEKVSFSSWIQITWWQREISGKKNIECYMSSSGVRLPLVLVHALGRYHWRLHYLQACCFPTYIWYRTFSLSLCSVTPFVDANCKHKLFQDRPCVCALSAQVGRLQHGNHHRQVRLQVRQQGDHQLFRSARASCTTSGEPPVRNENLDTYIQAYILHLAFETDLI